MSDFMFDEEIYSNTLNMSFLELVNFSLYPLLVSRYFVLSLITVGCKRQFSGDSATCSWKIYIKNWHKPCTFKNVIDPLYQGKTQMQLGLCWNLWSSHYFDAVQVSVFHYHICMIIKIKDCMHITKRFQSIKKWTS